MRENIHPEWYPEAQVICACGQTWTVGATVPEIRTDICSSCHPFFTGEMRIVDTEGQVDRFMKRLQARDQMLSAAQARDDEPSRDQPIDSLDLGTRPTNALTEAGVETVDALLALLAEGDQALLDIQGFGRKALIDTKKALRAQGFELPNEDEAEAEAAEAGA
jgi:large subunit ribosomal protein L31